MLVKDIMVPVEKLVILSPMASIREALIEMKKHNVRSVIIDKNGPHGAYGLLTYKNLLGTIVAEEGDIDLLNAYDIGNIPALSISAQMDVKYAAKLMVNSQIKRILVTDNNNLEGIITQTDIMGYIMKNVV